MTPRKKVRIILDGERPQTWNKYWSGQHWAVRKADADRVHMLVRAAIDPSKAFIYDNPVKITISVWFKSHPQDAPNICTKPYIDALQNWYIEDDNPKFLPRVEAASYVDKRRPRLEIEIEELIVPF